jgi:hypothetical protein
LTIKTMSDTNFIFTFLGKGTEDLAAFLTIKTDPFQHWPYSASTGDDAAYFDETV